MFPFHTKSYILIIEYWLRGNASEFLLRKTRRKNPLLVQWDSDFFFEKTRRNYGFCWYCLGAASAGDRHCACADHKGSLLYTNFSPVGTIEAIFEVMMEKLGDSWNVGILIFLVFLGIIVALMTRAGGSAAYGKWAGSKIKTRSGALLSTFALGVVIWKCHASCHGQAEEFPCETGLYH